jgi:hypothetical protein
MGRESSAAHKRRPCDSMIERLLRHPHPGAESLGGKGIKYLVPRCGGRPTPVLLTEINS